MIWTCSCGCRVDDPSNGASGTTCAECMAKGVAPVAVAPTSLSADARERLGRAVRETWVDFAREQPDPKPHHLLPWDDLDEANKEVDRRIGERLFFLGADCQASAALTPKAFRAMVCDARRSLVEAGFLSESGNAERKVAMMVTQAAVAGLDLDALEAKARAATPGPWRASEHGGSAPIDRWWTVESAAGMPRQIARVMSTVKPDATFIAAASPDVVLALVTAARRGAFYEKAYKAAHASQRRLRAALDAIALNGSDPACVRTAEEALEADDRARGVE